MPVAIEVIGQKWAFSRWLSKSGRFKLDWNVWPPAWRAPQDLVLYASEARKRTVSVSERLSVTNLGHHDHQTV